MIPAIILFASFTGIYALASRIPVEKPTRKIGKKAVAGARYRFKVTGRQITATRIGRVKRGSNGRYIG